MEKIAIVGSGIGKSVLSSINDKVVLVEPPSEEVSYIKPVPSPEIGINYMRSIFGENSIPPKVYGMNYVKRGTHKRTNKKK